MPPKRIKLNSGTIAYFKSWRLPNGNLLILQRMGHDRTLLEYVEVAPGSSLNKRWQGVSVNVPDDEPDPRESPSYIKKQTAIKATKEYQEWRRQQPQ